jgi:hypothetical protein
LSFVSEQRFDTEARDKLPSSFQTAVSTARASLDAEDTREEFIDTFPALSGHILEDCTAVSLVRISQVYFSMQLSRSPHLELLYIFILHCLVLESVSVEERAQHLKHLHADLLDILTGTFFPILFQAVDVVVSSTDASADIDGHLFVALIWYLIANPSLPMSEVVGSGVYQRTETIWSKLGLPPIDLVSFASQFPNPAASLPRTLDDKPLRLLPFDNDVFNDALSSIHVEVDQNIEIPFPTQAHLEFGGGMLFTDTRHWHNPNKSILPKHLGGEDTKPKDSRQRRKALRKDQNFMKVLLRQAETLTGALGTTLEQAVIAPVGSTQNSRSSKMRPSAKVSQQVTSLTWVLIHLFRIKPPPPPAGTKGKAKPLSKKEKLLMHIANSKQATKDSSSAAWWQKEVDQMKTMNSAETTTVLKSLMRNKKSKEPAIGTEMRLYLLHLDLQRWTEDERPDSPAARDHYTVSVMRKVRDVIDFNNVTPTVSEILSSVLGVLGFSDYASAVMKSAGNSATDRPLAFTFIKLKKSKTKSVVYPFMRITEHPVIWQLRLFGEFMDRSMDSKADSRVAFAPDDWQRQVLDVIDEGSSLLVVGLSSNISISSHLCSCSVIAPTSAGKTFISYYAMERLLRTSDDGILVYVAPTKALVTQIAAEVSARFSKEMNGSR